MNASVFISSSFDGTAGKGVSRAARQSDGGWNVEFLLDQYDVRSLAADPINRSVIYAGTQGQGILRSEDCGRTWRPAGLEGKIVKSIAVSPHEANTLYAGTKPPYLYVSRDGGENWMELEGFRRVPGRWWWFSPGEPPYLRPYVQAIAVSPTAPQVILAGIEFGAVLRSTDGGKTWSGHRKGALRDCHSLTFHARDGDWVYEAGGSGGGAAVSRDGGVTWRKVKEGLDRNYGWACAADPEKPEVWYLSASPGPNKAHSRANAQAYIFRTVGGAAWERLAGGLPQPMDHMLYALITDSGSPGHMYAGLSNGDIWFSQNYGDDWSQLPVSMGGIWRTLIML